MEDEELSVYMKQTDVPSTPLVIFGMEESDVTQLVPPKLPRVAQEGGRVRGWGSVCSGVLGVPLLVNKECS